MKIFFTYSIVTVLSIPLMFVAADVLSCSKAGQVVQKECLAGQNDSRNPGDLVGVLTSKASRCPSDCSSKIDVVGNCAQSTCIAKSKPTKPTEPTTTNCSSPPNISLL